MSRPTVLGTRPGYEPSLARPPFSVGAVCCTSVRKGTTSCVRVGWRDPTAWYPLSRGGVLMRSARTRHIAPSFGLATPPALFRDSWALLAVQPSFLLSKATANGRRVALDRPGPSLISTATQPYAKSDGSSFITPRPRDDVGDRLRDGLGKRCDAPRCDGGPGSTRLAALSSMHAVASM